MPSLPSHTLQLLLAVQQPEATLPDPSGAQRTANTAAGAHGSSGAGSGGRQGMGAYS